MTATPDDHLDKAQRVLADARRFVPISARVVAREGYMAAFHAAEALLLARSGRAAKTHKGVNIAFALQARDDPALGEVWASFLVGSYEVNHQGDYAVGAAEQQYGPEDAERIIRSPAELIAIVKLLLGS